MEIETKLSAAQAEATQLQKKTTRLDATAESIARLTDYAIEKPESSEQITAVLKGVVTKRRGTQSAAAAIKALETIFAVSMLRALQG